MDATLQPHTPIITTSAIVALCHTGGAGWARVDENGARIDTAPDFDAHPLYAAIQPVEIDGQSMIRIPAFHLRVSAAPEGTQDAGRPCWSVSQSPAEGFALHPAFMLDGVPQPSIVIGAFEGAEADGKLICQAGVDVRTMINLAESKALCETRSGFRLMSAYEAAAVLVLQLIEMGNADSQKTIARGNVDGHGSKKTGTTGATWRGINEWWGNHWEWLDGLKVDENGLVQVWDAAGHRQWVDTGVTLGIGNDWGFPAAFHAETGSGFDLSALFLPSALAASQKTAAAPDRVWGYWSGRESVPVRGGYWVGESGAGAFALGLDGGPGDRGGSLSFRPAFAL